MSIDDMSIDDDVARARDLAEAADDALFGARQHIAVRHARADLASTPFWDVTALGAFDGAELTGLATVMAPLREDTNTVHLQLQVAPHRRGRGTGAALAAAADAFAAAAGRTGLTWWIEAPLDGEADDPDGPAGRIARRLGATRRNVAVARALDLPVAEPALASLEAEAAPHRDGYRLASWRGPIPSEHFTAYGALLAQLELDEPDEDVEAEIPVYDAERLGVINARRAERGLDWLTVVALAPDGAMIGNSEIQAYADASTRLAWQENTLVMPEHRGHRLGIAMKAHLHRLLAAARPDLARCVTFNSHVNGPMIAINERLGYRPIHREVCYQRSPR